MNESADTTPPEIYSGSPHAPVVNLSLRYAFVLWLVFFLICLGLGYPTLKRYDPARAEGLTDAIVYRQMVAGTPGPRPHAEVFAGRVLVPGTARVIYRLIGTRINAVDPITLSLLLAASIFCAATATLLVIISCYLTGNPSAGLSAALLYLISFAVPNFQLAGLIDSGESFFMLLLTGSLLFRRWWLLPLCGIGGALAKETFLPFATIFGITWWVVEGRQPEKRFVTLSWIGVLILSSAAGLILVRSLVLGHAVSPWQIATALNAGTEFFPSLLRCLVDRSFWYVFAWLLPLGLLGFRRVPKAWLWPALIASLGALMLGAFNNMGGTVARPIFNIAGPMFSFSGAMLLARMLSTKQVAER